SLFIALAAVIDFFDGFVARAMKTTSAMGKQLDSLADVVSFGVAPGLIIYQFLRLSVAGEENGLNASFAWLLPALLLPCAAAWRLARFNLNETQTYPFQGVPVPAVGLLVASFPLIFWHSSDAAVTGIFLNKWIWYAVVVLLGWLMISGMPVMSLKGKDYSFKNNRSKWILVLLAIILAVLFKWTAVPLIFIAYILLSLPLKNKSTS
ncbi:MAG TPA: CDP-alcohol phosphatidyltransferase family protein, partial [Agriterribacter sp.]|nr:CDP-alcohol phosphatidyltransferase family protein [Agriterribacter sp.]